MNSARFLVAATVGAVLASVHPVHAGEGCSSHANNATHQKAAYGGKRDIVETAVAAGSFKTLAAALQAADLAGALQGEGPFTVFAPTDDAFAQLPKGTLDELLKKENKPLLTAILTYHVVPGKLMASDVVTRTNLTTLNGQRADISLTDGARIDQASIVSTDIKCTNGVIHVIDRVIMPSTDSILDTAGKAGSFGTLAAAIKAAGLVEALSGTGPVTVLAPTDAAFERLPAGTVETLLRPENRHDLVAILKYHVIPGRVYAGDALRAGTAETAEGSRVRFGLEGGMLMVNGAGVVQPDIDASNGVIHIIDAVIIPQ